MQLNHHLKFVRVLLFSTMLWASYKIAFTIGFRTGYEQERSSLREWKSWIDTMTQKVQGHFCQLSSGETILRESDVPVFLMNSSCFVALAPMSLDERRKILSETDLIAYEHFLGIRNRYVVDFLKSEGYKDEDIDFH